MKVLLVSLPGVGHLASMKSIASWLVRRGHEVGWLSAPSRPQHRPILVPGVETVDMPARVPRVPVEKDPERHLAKLAARQSSLESIRAFVRLIYIDLVPVQVEGAREVIEGYAPDLVVSDSLCYAGVIAAHLARRPCVHVSTALTMVVPEHVRFPEGDVAEELAGARARMFEREGQGLHRRFKFLDCLSPMLNLVFTTRELVGDDHVPPRTLLAGPFVPVTDAVDDRFPWDRLDPARPLIFASQGTTNAWPVDTLKQIVESAAAIGGQLVFARGAGLLWKELPADVICVDHVPQVALLDRTAVFVTHGGANSFAEAVRAGVRMLVLPIGHEQGVQAHLVEQGGFGRALAPDERSSERMRQAMSELLEDARFASALAPIRASYNRSDGGLQAAVAIEAAWHARGEHSP